MTTATVTLNVAGNATQQLQKLENQLAKVSKSFLGLRNALAGVSIGAFVNSALKFADAMDDTAKATGLATANVIGFSQALQANGGSAEDAGNALFKFVENIGEAVDGSLKMQETFAKVGVSLNDLATLSEQDLLQKVIQGLNGIADTSLRAKLQVDLLGKGFKGIDLKGFANDYDAATAAAGRYAQSNKTAADANEKLKSITIKVQEELLRFLEPVNRLITSIDENSESFMRWMGAIQSVIKVLFVIFGIIVPIVRVFNLLRASIIAVRAAMKLGAEEFSKYFSSLKGWLTNWPKVLEIVQNGIKKAQKGLDDPKTRVPEYYEKRLKYWTKIQDALETVKKTALGTAAAVATAVAGFFGYQGGGPTEEDLQPVKVTGKRVQREVDTGEAQKQIANITEITKKYKEQNDQLIKNIQSEATYLKMSEDAAEIAKAQTEIYDNAISAITDLQNKAIDASASEKAAILEQIKVIEKSIIVDQMRAETAIKNLQNIREEQDKLIKQTELQKLQLSDDAAIKALQDQIALIQLYGDELENANIALEVSQSLEQTLLELRQQELDLLVKKGKLTDEQYQRELAQIEALRQAAYKRAGEEIDAKTKTQEAQRAADEDASLGIKKYLDELEKGTTPAKRSLESVKTVFNSMDSALETFVKTGKFKFKDFALSVVQDLLLIQAKAALVSIFSSVLKGLGIFGFAEGGNVKGGTPIVVGEKGPELFVPPSSGKIVPNNQLGTANASGGGGGPVTNNYITNNISAIDAKGVAQLFAENRKTLLGSVKMAEREMPYMAR